MDSIYTEEQEKAIQETLSTFVNNITNVAEQHGHEVAYEICLSAIEICTAQVLGNYYLLMKISGRDDDKEIIQEASEYIEEATTIGAKTALEDNNLDLEPVCALGFSNGKMKDLN